MPCRDPDDYDFFNEGPLRRRLDEVTRLLCMAMQSAEDGVKCPIEVMAWWHEHKEADRLRKEQEEQHTKVAEMRRVLRERGLSKLTDEERKALGIH